MNALKYPIPDFLSDIMTPKEYSGWIVDKAYDVHHRDMLRKSPWLIKNPSLRYGAVIHEAVIAGNGIDPFTKDHLRFDLIHSWDPQRASGDTVYQKQFYSMPTVDHIDPEARELALEICSWQINACKSQQNPMEFVEMCRKIVEFEKNAFDGTPQPLTPSPFYGEGGKETRPIATMAERKHEQGEMKDPPKYFPPDFLEGIITPAFYRKWLHHKAHVIYHQDKHLNKQWALRGSEAFYEQRIHEAVLHGKTDPFTGDTLQWELIGLWTDKKDPIAVEKKFRLMPTVDHIDPNACELAFEICSWLINTCKWNMNRQEFIAVCGKVCLNLDSHDQRDSLDRITP